jgi:UPF0755 protein
MTRRRVAAAAGLTFMLLAGLGAGTAWVARERFNAAGPLNHPRDVVVPRGAPPQVAEALLHEGVIANARDFRVATLLTRSQGPLHAAEFAFPAGASLRQVLDVLRTARPVQHRLTIPEGLTAAQIAELLDRAEGMTGDEPVPDEGAMLPQSYSYEYGTPREAVMARAVGAMRRALAEAWAERAPEVKLATPEEMLILASIVERETAKPAERPHVAAVFLNRLRLGMKLQSDPTVAYAVSGGLETAKRGITRAELNLANPYNTYHAAGLPPGPIDSPGVASLLAVAQPAQSDDLYFVADGSGGHVFARTLEEHNRNVARWRAAQANPAQANPASIVR